MEQNISFDKLDEAISFIYENASKYAANGVENNIGGPFGAGIIQLADQKFSIISISRNTVIQSSDPTCHAEVNAIREACKKLNKLFLDDCILVTTAKSCPMCLSAAIWAKIPTIYYSENYDSATAADFKDDKIADYIKHNTTLIKEIHLENPNTIRPFKIWNAKKDRINY
ncbi:MAG: nucleoside deaminase [Bacteroidales bacterium]|nr:nucleoside deaminase [Bacteroidales bacterium]